MVKLKNEHRFQEYIKKNEGLVKKLYYCSEGFPTIGYGHKCKPDEVKLYAKPISTVRARFIFKQDFAVAVGTAYKVFPHCIESLSENRQMCIVDMAFNLGETGLRKFKKMVKAVEEKNFDKASDEIMDSKYAKQVKGRAKTNADYMRMG